MGRKSGGLRISGDAAYTYARQHGYVARSAPKLSEILRRFPQLIGTSQTRRRPRAGGGRGGGVVLDVGCAPGAWLQTLFRSNTQRPSFIVGVDMQRVDSRVIQELQVEETNISGGAIYASGGGGGGGGGEGIDTRGIALVQRRLGDNHKEDVQVLTAALRIASGGAVRRFNTILSDLAPKTTGYGDGLASVEAASIAARLATADKYDAYGADNDDDHHHEDDVQGSDADDTSASFQLLVPGGNLCVTNACLFAQYFFVKNIYSQ